MPDEGAFLGPGELRKHWDDKQESAMKHSRPITRVPAAAASALAVKLDFKASLSNSLVAGTSLLLNNLANGVSGLVVNSLNTGEFIEIIIEDIGDIFGGGA